MNAKLKYLTGFIYGLALLLSPSVVYAAEKLIIRGSNNYPPFEFINKEGNPDGFNVDIIKALMKELELDYELKLDDWAKVSQDIQDKRIDLVIGMIYSPDRAANVRFTLPTCIINRDFITRKSDNIRSVQDLQGKEIIVERGGWFHQYLKNNNLAGKIIESGDIYESLRLLSEGKHDAVLASELVAVYAIKQMKLKDLHIGELGISPQNYSIAVNQNHDKLLYQLNIGLQHLKLSGEYDQIYNKWFGIYESQKIKAKLLIVLAVILFIAALLALFVLLLRKQVSRATRMLNYSKQEVEIAIDAGKISAWTYTIHDRVIKSLHGNSLGGKGKSIEMVYKTIHPEDVEKVKNAFNALSSNLKKELVISFRIKTDEAQVEYRYVETKMMRVEATKELPCRIVGTLKDTTEEVMIRQELEDHLIKSEFIIRTNGIVLIQYDITERLFTKINEGELIKQQSYSIEKYLSMVHIEDISIALLFIENLNRAETPTLETEFRIMGDNGEYQWNIITATAYKYNEQGEIISYIGLRQNNTKWKTINNDLIMLREKAEASNRLKSAFLANMSHEIRTPLNAIVGFSELITETEDREERSAFIEIVKNNNELLLQLINDVLDLSRIEAGFINFNYATFDFPTYFNEMYLSLKIKETRGVELICINTYHEISIHSDSNRITQVITNFVTNAFKFTTRGSITLSYTYENEGIKVSVTDTGIGITPENQKRVFERFEKINDFAQGTGLGLSICKVIIEALQGNIGVDSDYGKGSTFWFWIPSGNQKKNNQVLVKEEKISPDKGLPFSTSTQAADNTLQKRKTILIAEDIDNNYIIISTIVKEAYHIIRAENGIEAVEKTKLYNPDIILMDMKMPLMDGLEATKEIRKFDADIPIIALTAYVFDTNKEDALCAGCNDFISKPVNRSLLMQVLNKCE